MNKSTQVRKSPDFINKQFIKFIWFCTQSNIEPTSVHVWFNIQIVLKIWMISGSTDIHFWFSTEMIT